MNEDCSSLCAPAGRQGGHINRYFTRSLATNHPREPALFTIELCSASRPVVRPQNAILSGVRVTSVVLVVAVIQLSVGEWLSLVEHLVRDQGVGGSNPLSPTNCFQLLTAAAEVSKTTHLVLQQVP